MEKENSYNKGEEINNLQKARIAATFGVGSEDVLQKSEEDLLLKGGQSPFPIGTIHNGYKKVAEGQWKKVSDKGMTKQEHLNKEKFSEKDAHSNRKNPGIAQHYSEEASEHRKNAEALDDNNYDDNHVTSSSLSKDELKAFHTEFNGHNNSFERMTENLTVKLVERGLLNRSYARGHGFVEKPTREGRSLLNKLKKEFNSKKD